MQDMHNELQDVMGQSFGVPDDIDEVLHWFTQDASCLQRLSLLGI